MLIRKELNENVSTTQQDLQHIKGWLAKQPHLPQFEGTKDCDAHKSLPLCLIPIQQGICFAHLVWGVTKSDWHVGRYLTYRVFQKQIYNFVSVYKFIQRT
jgi:hypothetical protein